MKNPFFCFNFILRGKGWSVIIPHMTKDAGGKDRYETQSQIAASLADVSVCAVAPCLFDYFQICADVRHSDRLQALFGASGYLGKSVGRLCTV